MSESGFSIAAQIEEVVREIALREKVYPRQVQSRKMTQGVADYHMARMKAVLRTLQWLQRRELNAREYYSTVSGGEHGSESQG